MTMNITNVGINYYNLGRIKVNTRNNYGEIILKNLTRKHLTLFDYELNGSIIYELAFSIYFVIAFFQTSTYTSYFGSHLLHELAFIPLLLVAFKIIFLDSINVKTLCFNLIILALLVITWRTSGEFILFPLGIFILGARNVVFKRIINIYLILGTILLAFIFFSSLIGLTRNLIYYRGFSTDVVRQSFGIVYPTDFAAHILYLVLAFCYLRFGKLSWLNYLAIIILAFLVIHFCDARLNAVALLLIIPVMMIGQWAQKENKVAKVIASFYWTLPVLAFYISIFITFIFSPSKSEFDTINSFLSGRLFLGHFAIEKYGVKLFGQTIHENGLGATVNGVKPNIDNGKYFYIDSSIIRLLVIYGVIMLLLIVVAMTIISWQSTKYHDFALASIMVIVTVSAIVEQRLLDFAYDPFLIALFAQCYSKKYVIEKILD